MGEIIWDKDCVQEYFDSCGPLASMNSEKIQANLVVILTSLLSTIIHWNATIIALFFTWNTNFPKYGSVHYLIILN